MALRIRTDHPYNVVEGDEFLDIPAAEALLNKQAQELADARSALKEALDAVKDARAAVAEARSQK